MKRTLIRLFSSHSQLELRGARATCRPRRMSSTLFTTAYPCLEISIRPRAAGHIQRCIFIHGGGFARGSKAGYGNTWGPYLAARGYVVFAIDYRLSTPTQATWPQALLDCKAAVQYLRGNAAALGIDPDRIGVGGDSAGASLAALVGGHARLSAIRQSLPKGRLRLRQHEGQGGRADLWRVRHDGLAEIQVGTSE